MNISYRDFLEKVMDKLNWVTDEVDFLYPYTTRQEKYENEKGHPFSWTAGFYGGILWYMYMLTKEDKFLKLAKKSASRFDKCLSDFVDIDHDIGFQFLHTSVADYQLTGDESSKVRALHAATILAGRYNSAGQFIRAWNENPYIDGDTPKNGYAIIDCMMNLPLLFWASEVTGDSRFKQIACSHADMVKKHFVRKDGSVNHIVVFDPDTGEVVNKPAGQGYAPGSAWTRGQAWAVYGFAMAYHYTGNIEYLETAILVTRYFVSNVKDGYMPIDFAQPLEPQCMDTSAAAIGVCGLLEILRYISADEKEFYQNAVEDLMDILYQNCNFEQDEQSILQNGSVLYHNKDTWHIPLIYGDFYLLEALVRLNGGDVLFY